MSLPRIARTTRRTSTRRSARCTTRSRSEGGTCAGDRTTNSTTVTRCHGIVPLRLIGTALFLFSSLSQHCSSSTHRHSIVPLQLIVTALFLINSSSQYCSSSTHRHSIVPHQLIVTALFLFDSVHGRFTLFQFLLTTCKKKNRLRGLIISTKC